MKRLILTQQQLADAYAVPVKSSIYQYFLGLSDMSFLMTGILSIRSMISKKSLYQKKP